MGLQSPAEKGCRSVTRNSDGTALWDEGIRFSSEIKGAAMIYRKNLPGWERAMRLLGGAVMIACGLLGLPGTPIGYLIAGAGAMTAATGFFGFCPMCAMVGRRLQSP